MKKTVIIILFILPIFLLVTIAFAGRILSQFQHISVTKVEFIDEFGTPYEYNNPEHVIELQIGEYAQTIVSVKPVEASDKNVEYSSSAPEICEVDANGELYGVSYGRADITVITHDGNKKAVIKVFVKADKVQGITLPQNKISLVVGETFELKPTVELPSAKDKRVTYISDNPAVARVDAKGKITAKGPGTATIIATTVDGEYKASCKVTVEYGELSLFFDFSSADFITQDEDIYNTTQRVIDLKNYIRFNDALIKAEDIRFRIQSGGSRGTLEDGVLTLNIDSFGSINIIAYVENTSYTAEAKFSLQR